MRPLLAPVITALLATGTPLLAQTPGVPDGRSDATAVTVNGTAITRAEIESMIQTVIARQTGGRPLPPEQLPRIRETLYPQVLEQLIDDALLDQEAQRRSIEMTKEECLSELEAELGHYSASSGLPEAYMRERVAEAQGMTFEEFLAARVADPALRSGLLQRRLIRTMRPEATRVSEEEIAADYAANKEELAFPTFVRASHILIGTEDMSAEQKATARAKAASVRDLARSEGADFAELAKSHSTGPSGPRGGDLGYFPKEQMVPPFAEAAFAMEIGAVSDVVETEFGYHVIHVVDRREARELTLEQASDMIRARLEMQKVDEARADVLAGLREAAQIDYPGEKG